MDWILQRKELEFLSEDKISLILQFCLIVLFVFRATH